MKKWAIYSLLHTTFFVYSLGGVAGKKASDYPFFSIQFMLMYSIVIFLLFFYAIVWQQTLKHLALTVAYANKSITLIWGMIWGALLFNEKVSWNMVVGSIVISVGVYLVVQGDE